MLNPLICDGGISEILQVTRETGVQVNNMR
jgi:hypothetical protein